MIEVHPKDSDAPEGVNGDVVSLVGLCFDARTAGTCGKLSSPRSDAVPTLLPLRPASWTGLHLWFGRIDLPLISLNQLGGAATDPQEAPCGLRVSSWKRGPVSATLSR